MSTHELAARLARVDRLPYGPARTAAAESLARTIIENGPVELAPRALLDLVEAYTFDGADTSRAFAPFARVLRLWDTSPELFDESTTHGLFWEFKWLVSAAIAHPQITASQTEALIDDMERRYRIAGHSLDSVAKARLSWENNRGGDVRAALAQWLRATSDETSDCPACDVGTRAHIHVALGEYAEAVRIGRTQRGSCNREPASTLFTLALAELLNGEPEAADATLKSARRFASADESDTSSASRGEEFETLARGGQCILAVQRVAAEYPQTLTDDSDPQDRLGLLVALLRGLSANPDLAHDACPAIPGLAGIATIGQLAQWVEREAEALAQRFDARNGTSHQRERVARALAATPAPRPLPDPTRLEAPTSDRPPASGGDLSSAGQAQTRGSGDGIHAQGATGAATAEGLRAAADALGIDAPERAAAYERAALAAEEDGLLAEAGVAWANSAVAHARDEHTVEANRAYARAWGMLVAGDAPARLRARIIEAWAPHAHGAGEHDAFLDAVAREIGSADGETPARAAQADRESADDAAQAADELAAQRLLIHAVLTDARARVAASRADVTTATGAPATSDTSLRHDALAWAEQSAGAFERLGLLADAAHSGWLAARLAARLDDTQRSDALYRASIAAFKASGSGEHHAQVAGEFIGLLRERGDVRGAEIVIDALTRD